MPFPTISKLINAKENAASSCSFYRSLKVLATNNKKEGLKQRQKQGVAKPRKAKGLCIIIKKNPVFRLYARA